jgi:hypothetical protein
MRQKELSFLISSSNQKLKQLEKELSELNNQILLIQKSKELEKNVLTQLNYKRTRLLF